MEPRLVRGREGSDESVGERRTRERRVWRVAFLASVVLHVLIFLFGPRGSVLIAPMDAAGPDQGDNTAADGTMTVVALSSAPPAPIVRPAAPVFTADVPVPEALPEDPTAEIALDLPEIRDPGVGATTGDDPGDLPDAGIPGATGAGNAGTTVEGRARLVPPSPRGLIIPPTNSDLRGSRVEVWVFVDEQGRVVADSTRLEPPTSDGGFNSRLLSEAAEWAFEPARENGEPVAAWFPYTISME
jgi:hypothetical protein